MADLYGANSLKEEALRHLVANRKEEVVKVAIREALKEIHSSRLTFLQLWISKLVNIRLTSSIWTIVKKLNAAKSYDLKQLTQG